MTSQLIINVSNSKRPLVRARDGILFFSCWSMWGAVLLAIVNGCDWRVLSDSLERWLVSQDVFLRAVLAAFHIPVVYVMMLCLLVSAFLLWSMLNLALAPQRRMQDGAPLTLADMARHFHLDLALIDAMQKERQVLVFHALSGAVTELRRVQSRPQHQLLPA